MSDHEGKFPFALSIGAVPTVQVRGMEGTRRDGTYHWKGVHVGLTRTHTGSGHDNSPTSSSMVLCRDNYAPGHVKKSKSMSYDGPCTVHAARGAKNQRIRDLRY